MCAPLSDQCRYCWNVEKLAKGADKDIWLFVMQVVAAAGETSGHGAHDALCERGTVVARNEQITVAEVDRYRRQRKRFHARAP